MSGKNGRRKGHGGQYDLISKAKQELPSNTRQMADFESYGDYIPPPYDPEDLLKIVEESDILKPLIGALASNLASFGWGIRYKQDFDFNKAESGAQKQAALEWIQLENLYKYFNPLYSFSKVLYKACSDKESIGWGCVEIIRDLAGNIAGGEYARACNFRLAPQKKEDRVAYIKQKRYLADGKLEEVEVPRLFKKFVQIINGDKVFFKEFGDPRPMNWQTGEYGAKMDTATAATEIVFLANHSSYSDYGAPKWSGNIPNIIGNRKSEELNLAFFIQGKMMPFAILVSGGQLSEESIEVLQNGKGIENAYKALVLEALPDDKSGIDPMNPDKPRVDIRIEHLTDTGLKDGLFMDYQKANRDKVRAAFRLPPIYLGDSTDYTKATADVSKIIAEEQVFVPEREEIANLFNAVVGNELGIGYCEMYLKGPVTGDLTEIAGALAPFIQAGTVTPNMLIDTLADLLGKDIEVVLPDELGNVPIEILKLQMQQAALMNPATEPKDQANQTNEEDIQKMAAVYTFGEMLSILKDYLGDTDAY